MRNLSHTVVVVWAVLLLLLLLDTVHARKVRLRDRDADHPVSQTQVPLPQEPWFPQRVTRQRVAQQQQRQQLHLSRVPWLPQQMVQQTQNRRRGGSWEPLVVQQSQSDLPEDSWLPQTGQQSQIEGLEFPVQQTQMRPITEDCHFNFDDVPQKHIHPMLVRPDKSGFVYPKKEGKSRMMHLAKGISVMASCPGKDNTLFFNGRSYAYITCSRGQLMIGREPVQWSNLGCHKKPKPTLREGGRCDHNGRSRIIGWSIRRRVFIPQITLCFDERQETTLYAFHHIYGRNIDAKVVETSRPGFRTGKMFSMNTNKMRKSYSKTTQKSLVRSLMNTTEHLTGKNQHYLAKGHLAPDSDFVLEPEQDATYFYANVVPQWQAVNNGNWKRLEFAVRELAERLDTTLEVWTGTHGTLELPNFHRNPIKLFLGLTSGKEVVPVPAIMWKVIHDPATATAVAIVEVNDVGGQGTSDSWSLTESPCPDVCHQLPWVDWDTSDQRYGRTFCCSVNSLKSTIAELPSLGYVNLLRH